MFLQLNYSIKEFIVYVTNSDYTIKENIYTIKVPKGTRVTPITGGGGEISYAANCSNVSKQRNPHTVHN
jgi:hypothetical protein